MARFTILGASGFIGSNLAEHLVASGHEVARVNRDCTLAPGRALGHAVYCIGMTADFRTDLIGTVRAHVAVLADTLERYDCDSFLYLSSTRVYADAQDGREGSALMMTPLQSDCLYNLSKATGEALCLAQPRSAFRVVRLSNVIGQGSAVQNFLPSVLQEAHSTGRVTFHTSAVSSKDYVDIDDVCRLIERIALNGRERLYNVASGRATTNAELAMLLKRHLGTECEFSDSARAVGYPAIDIARIVREFGFTPTPFETSFASLLSKL